jgi:hypothetical protein
VESSCESGNEPLGPIKCLLTIEGLPNWWLLQKCSVSESQLASEDGSR